MSMQAKYVSTLDPTGDVVPAPYCECGIFIAPRDLYRGYHSCGRRLAIVVGDPDFAPLEVSQ